MIDPTKQTYDGLAAAYDFFNAELFEGRLPRCLLTMQRKNKAYGYFAGSRFGTVSGDHITDEIALNPSHFRARTTEESLSTLVHEMTHLEQHHFGKPSRSGYHNREWAGLMRRVGLIPTDTGQPGGRETGQQMTHYIEPEGRFAASCAALIGTGYTVQYVELWGDNDAKKRKTKAASKTRYSCPDCDVNAWGKPGLHLRCGDCDASMEAGEAE